MERRTLKGNFESLTMCFEPSCTLPGHVSRVHEAEAAPSPEDDGLDAAWKAAEAALPKGNDLWLAATGPGYVASTTYPGGERTVEAWAQSDRTLPNYVPNATPAAALRALTVRLSESSEGVERRDGA